MNNQVKSSFKKEYLAFSRTKKLLILICVFIGLSIFDPLMIRGMGEIMNLMGDVYDEIGMDVGGLTETLNSSAKFGVSSAISDLSMAGLLVFLLLINSFAGGEQKKRSIIIPRCSGLGNTAYLLPKFIIYPVVVFILSVAGILVAGGVSALVFDVNDIVISQVLCGGVLMGVYLALFVCLHLALGTATGRAGMSSAVCIVASILLPNMFALLGSELSYNPFALSQTAASVLYHDLPAGDLVATCLIAVGIMAAVYFLALFAQNAKKIDNSGNEIII